MNNLKKGIIIENFHFDSPIPTRFIGRTAFIGSVSPEQWDWTNFSTIGIGIMQQVLNPGESGFCLGRRAGRLRDECANHENHHY
jgi:hypothetical protein